ncbi:hypothetical protein 32HC_30 [Mycobacterium phage 32HC]|uniref:DUF7572 domain-containing protein n=1 Tax=Mycobacterium phage 32HC TaxID=1445729 RepID=W8EAE1_9CAUD|nr:minor tail protein [Mycobacterium phage 32HC]AHJ86308.1 hypothetical protein 32HC_30 [Mycobacterium phage 32HC]
MDIANLIAEALPQFCPTTNHYRCSDGKYLLVTVPTIDPVGTLAETLGIVVAVAKSHLPATVDVFLSDEYAAVLDADGDLANGLTPIATFPAGTSHAEALALMGYSVER